MMDVFRSHQILERLPVFFEHVRKCFPRASSGVGVSELQAKFRYFLWLPDCALNHKAFAIAAF
jgi:hypothetical protein